MRKIIFCLGAILAGASEPSCSTGDELCMLQLKTKVLHRDKPTTTNQTIAKKDTVTDDETAFTFQVTAVVEVLLIIFSLATGNLLPLLMISGALNNVTGKIKADLLQNYNGAVTVIANNLCYLLVFWFGTVLFYVKGWITSREMKFMWRKDGAWNWLLLGGILDLISSLTGFISLPYINVIVYSASNQALMFWVILWSYLLFGRKYVALECVGMVLVITGVVLAVAASPPQNTENKRTEVMWVIVNFLGGSAIALSSVIKEKVFRMYRERYEDDSRLHVLVVASANNLFATVFSIPMYFLAATIQGRDAWSDITVGFAISLTEPVTLMVLVLYLFINITLVIAAYAVTSHGSALLTFLAFKSILPLTAICAGCFVWPVIGQAYLPFAEIVALGVIMFGIWMYREGSFYRDVSADRNVCCYPIFK